MLLYVLIFRSTRSHDFQRSRLTRAGGLVVIQLVRRRSTQVDPERSGSFSANRHLATVTALRIVNDLRAYVEPP